ncbi:unnamed protein product [Pleuronectes platessa]|uniref:Uncharacterized protein n=1 Tax=Pleuronectes platessa TaxID=8262 RepID=A0A9N7VMH4_PLEPL|nr:unnamed protein product [Pleuronectes platessa]
MGVGEDKKAGVGIETKEGSRPDKTIGGSQGDDMVATQLSVTEWSHPQGDQILLDLVHHNITYFSPAQQSDQVKPCSSRQFTPVVPTFMTEQCDAVHRTQLGSAHFRLFSVSSFLDPWFLSLIQPSGIWASLQSLGAVRHSSGVSSRLCLGVGWCGVVVPTPKRPIMISPSPLTEHPSGHK